jgi:arginase family enzyme
MHIQLLHLDDGLRHQRAFLEACQAEGAGETDLSAEAGAIRLWGKERDIEKLGRTLPAVGGARLAVMGSSDFHHVTALLVQQLDQSGSQPFTIVQFDNHPDWVRFKGGLHCGSWVNRALSHPNVRKVVTIGVTSNDLN